MTCLSCKHTQYHATQSEKRIFAALPNTNDFMVLCKIYLIDWKAKPKPAESFMC